ncbi:unnamed protein product [Didymodactylos carnosus]|uniref:F-actin-capping protein subunit alpha n=1 Tax=Didymodactylos carnosus TaxID=1234261 RepID=A0A813RCB8_9BILA|nr:unnamed protein product [Didymodactylos carnosus]CAF0791871.1 unnamed protein product [Didymodactylos carnosus]CAF3563108.1 unnamed protein product [Didymodactylos carnosus]CAF3574541.1 unnamed protein product [Didymodactylos carnosus]
MVSRVGSFCLSNRLSYSFLIQRAASILACNNSEKIFRDNGMTDMLLNHYRYATEIRYRKPVKTTTANPIPSENEKERQPNRKLRQNRVRTKKAASKPGASLSNVDLNTIYDRFDPLREQITSDPAFLDQLATMKNPLQRIVSLKDNDIRFSSRIMKAKNRFDRYKKAFVLLEGKRLVADAIQAGGELLSVYVTDKKILDAIDFSQTNLQFDVYKVSTTAFKTWSDVQTNQGIMALFTMPKPGETPFQQRIELPITVICDNVRDPGNMGTIIRTCASVGCDRLIATKGCVDIWDPKVIRSGMGAHFRLPMVNEIGWETLVNYIPNTSQIYLADHKYSMDPPELQSSSSDTKSKDEAAAKSLFKEMIDKQIKDRKRDGRNTVDNKRMKIEDRSYMKQDNRYLPLYRDVPIEYLPLWEAFNKTKSSDHTTIIIGGETEGISNQARKLTIEHSGKMVYIPLLNDVDSLNVGIALSVVLFEVRKYYEDIAQKPFTEGIIQQQDAGIAKRFIAHAPPGEFNEVFNDVRTLLNDDNLVRKSVSKAFAEYNKDQYIPTKIQNSDEECLITEVTDQGDGRFFDPRTRQTFKFDHLRREASEYQPHQPDEQSEPWRVAFEKELTDYVKERYPYGACTIVGASDGDTISLTAFIESHKYEPKNFWNGRWRSNWSISFSKGQSECEFKGLVKAQVHYYEDGNVQLVSSKDFSESISIQDEHTTTKEMIRIIKQAEDNYQQAVNENYQAMSESTFKALRRQLPITKAKIDWTKITAYKIGTELSGQKSFE